jgi:2-polyprenyl-3-methyl-5-hydroxy-6-metoxy-1,4-benzoquinol methylase
MSSEATIRHTPRGQCALCGGQGVVAYSGLDDRLFGATGTWNLKQCSESTCGLFWLDPMPLTEDLWKAYLKYYTHSARESGQSTSLPRRIYRRLKRGYQSVRYGYDAGSNASITRLFGRLMYLLPIHRTEADEEVRRLPALRGGRVLDVGCGTGEWMVKMRELGWQVEGNDFDENAVKVANGLGLSARLGSLEQQQYPDASFDAVVLNHVIEHVPDPIATIRECARILKPDGRLLVFTPNQDSYGRKVFGKAWRGLEPPRHLHIFNPASMSRLLKAGGIVDFTVRTSNSVYVWKLSHQLANPGAGKLTSRIVPQYWAWIEQAILWFKPGVGECLAVRARRT